MESTDIEDFTKALADVECRNNQRLFYRLFPAADLELPGGLVMLQPPKGALQAIFACGSSTSR